MGSIETGASSPEKVWSRAPRSPVRSLPVQFGFSLEAWHGRALQEVQEPVGLLLDSRHNHRTVHHHQAHPPLSPRLSVSSARVMLGARELTAPIHRQQYRFSEVGWDWDRTGSCCTSACRHAVTCKGRQSAHAGIATWFAPKPCLDRVCSSCSSRTSCMVDGRRAGHPSSAASQ